MSRWVVQHCVLNMTTRQYGPHPTSDLLGVDYFVTVPANTEFPRTLKLELFVRFFGVDLKPSRVRLTVTRLNLDRSDREVVYESLLKVCDMAMPGSVVLDRGYKLVNVRLTGEGEYVVRVFRWVKRRWGPKRRWRLLAAEYFTVQRAV